MTFAQDIASYGPDLETGLDEPTDLIHGIDSGGFTALSWLGAGHGRPTTALTIEEPGSDSAGGQLEHRVDLRDLQLRQTVQGGARIVPRELSSPKISFRELESWEGTVTSVLDDGFVATITSSINGMPEEAEFDLDEITEFDRDLLAPGAVFYWTIGYRRTFGEPLRRTSTLMFRRLPAYSRRSLTEAREAARQLKERLGWD